QTLSLACGIFLLGLYEGVEVSFIGPNWLQGDTVASGLVRSYFVIILLMGGILFLNNLTPRFLTTLISCGCLVGTVFLLLEVVFRKSVFKSAEPDVSHLYMHFWYIDFFLLFDALGLLILELWVLIGFFKKRHFT